MQHSSIVDTVLRGSHSIADRVKLARYAWQCSTCLVRSKHQVLIDWACSQLDSSKNKHDMRDVALLWSFQAEALAALAEAQRLGKEFSGKPAVSPVTVKNYFSQLLIATLDASQQSLEATSEAPQHLSAVLLCLKSLLACPQMSPLFLNRVERMVEVIVSVCGLLTHAGVAGEAVPWKKNYLGVVVLALRHFLSLLRQHSNRKKVFTLAVDKLLEPLLVLYGHLHPTREGAAGSVAAGSEQDECAEAVTLVKLVLTTAFFHREHLSQMPSVLSMSFAMPSKAVATGAAKKSKPAEKLHSATSYLHKLFTTLRELMHCYASNQSSQSFLWPSLIYELYLAAARSVQARPAAADMPFFFQMLSLLDLPTAVANAESDADSAAAAAVAGSENGVPVDVQLRAGSENGVPVDVQLTNEKCRCLLGLLSLVQTRKAYKVVDDQMTGSRHLHWLQLAVGWLVSSELESELVCKTLSVVLDLNHRAIEKHLDSVCSLLWRCMSGDNLPAVGTLLQEIMSTYSKLGQLDRLVLSLLPAAAASPFRGLPQTVEHSFSQSVQLLSVGQCRDLWNSFITFFVGVIPRVEQWSSAKHRRKSGDSSTAKDSLGLLTGAAVFSIFLANIHVTSSTLSSAVLDLLAETRAKVTLPLLEACQGPLALVSSPSPKAVHVVQAALHISHSLGQMAMFLFCCQGDGPEWSVPKSAVMDVVLAVCPVRVRDSGSLCVPSQFHSLVATGQALLSSPSISLLLRQLAVQWLRVNVAISDDQQTDDISDTASDGDGRDTQLDVAPGTSCLDEDDQRAVLSFITDFPESDLQDTAEVVGWHGPLAVTDDLTAQSAQLRLIMTHFHWLSQLFQPEHWSALASQLVDTISSSVQHHDSSIAMSSEALLSEPSLYDQCVQFLKSSDVQESRAFHSCLVSHAVQRILVQGKPALKSSESGKYLSKVLKTVSSECQALSASPQSRHTLVDACQKWSSLLHQAYECTRDQSKDGAVTVDEEFIAALETATQVLEVLPTFYFVPDLLSISTALVLVVICLRDHAAIDGNKTYQGVGDRCIALLARLIRQCNNVSDSQPMERSRRHAILSSLPALKLLLEFSSQRLEMCDGTQLAPRLELFDSLVTLALAHGPTEETDAEWMESFAKSFLSTDSDMESYHLEFGKTCLHGVLKVLKAKAPTVERRKLAISLCKGVTRKLLGTAVSLFSAEGSSLGGQLHAQRKWQRCSSCVDIVHAALLCVEAGQSRKLRLRVCPVVQSMLPVVLEILSSFFEDCPQQCRERDAVAVTSLTNLVHAALVHGPSLDISLEPELYRTCWQTAFKLISAKRLQHALSETIRTSTGPSGLLPAIVRSIPNTVWTEVLDSFTSDPSINVDWLEVARLLLQAEMAAENRQALCAAMVKLLPDMPNVLARQCTVLAEDREALNAFSLAMLSWTASLALYAKVHITHQHVGAILQLCNAVPVLAQCSRLADLCSRTGEVLHVLLRHHTVPTASHVPVVFSICLRLMRALMALSSFVFTKRSGAWQDNQLPTDSALPVSAANDAAQLLAQTDLAASLGDVGKLHTATEAFARILENVASKKSFAKYVPYLLSNYLTFSTQYPLQSQIKNYLLAGVYAMLACCGPHELSLLKATVSRSEQELFDPLYADFKKFFKYSGKI